MEQTVNEDLLISCETTHSAVFRVYEPEEVSVVAGASPRCLREINMKMVRADGVPLRRRLGGGGAVVLSPGMLVTALVTETASPFHNREYAMIVNSWIKEALESLGVRGIEERGIADLAVGGRKILGSSVYRRRNVFFYQSSLLAANDIGFFDRYLTAPVREPDYRAGRGHRDFCVTVRECGYRLSLAAVRERLAAVAGAHQGIPVLPATAADD